MNTHLINYVLIEKFLNLYFYFIDLNEFFKFKKEKYILKKKTSNIVKYIEYVLYIK